MKKCVEIAEKYVGRKLTTNEKQRVCAKARSLEQAKELHFFSSAEAARLCAEYSDVQRAEQPRDWLKIIWYGNGCGGKLVRFKAGNPYIPKNSRISEDSAKMPDNVRLANSVSRTKRRILEIMACNKWTWFFTGTLDPAKNDVNNLNCVYKRFAQFLRDFRKTQAGKLDKIAYCIIPEQHKSGAWHFHGVLHGLPESALHKFSAGENIPCRLKKMISGGTDVYTWKSYEKRFGWATLTRVQNHEAVSKYVTKYVTKDMAAHNLGNNRHLYYASRGLKKPCVLAEGESVNGLLPVADFESDWVATRCLSDYDEAAAIARRYLGVEIACCPENGTTDIDKNAAACYDSYGASSCEANRAETRSGAL